MRLRFFLFLLIGVFSISFIQAQNLQSGESTISVNTSDGSVLNGVIRVPFSVGKLPIAILISGSGPTDKDGNQPQMMSNSLKYLSDALYDKGIATLRFDKRGVGASKDAGKPESEMTLDTYVSDAKDWVNLIAKDDRFDATTLVGHSEGALIAMLVTTNNASVSKLVLLAAPGRNMADILKEQLSTKIFGSQKDIVYGYIDRLAAGEFIEDIPSDYNMLFRPSVQPYLISMMKYEPNQIITQIKQPILIIQGSTDIQVSTHDANLLYNANPKAEKKIIENMNHVLKDCTSTALSDQIATYTNHNLPINTELISTVVEFVKE